MHLLIVNALGVQQLKDAFDVAAHFVSRWAAGGKQNNLNRLLAHSSCGVQKREGALLAACAAAAPRLAWGIQRGWQI